MTREEFKDWLKSEVTVSGALQINIPDNEYDRLIDKELKGIYELNPDAAAESYCIISPKVFYTPEFRRNRIIQFPKCVLTVSKFVEMKRRNAMFGINDPDFSFNRAFMTDMWFGSQMNLDSIAFRTIQWSVWDQLKQFTLVDINHTWNYNKHELLVTGHDPRLPVFCGLFVKVPEEDLFDDYWSQKWIAAHCKLQANKIMTLFQSNLIGGTTINMSSYTEEANNDITACKEKWIENAKVPTFYTTP